jgi:hypothetical protein
MSLVRGSESHLKPNVVGSVLVLVGRIHNEVERFSGRGFLGTEMEEFGLRST